ncbi:MAG: DUF4252 domain-containing protein [Prevotellaceae bacterium]|jgi:hypothetical protein|nr:DUF4252 domain-containing protein [Prevotellaceae bacterium]
MKKLLCTFALILGSLSFLYSQTPEDIFKKFGTETNAQLMNIDGDMLAMVKAQAGEEAKKLKNIESMVVLELSQCEQEVKDRFIEETGKMKLDGNETLVKVTEENVNVKVVGIVDGDTVCDMIVIVTGDGCAMVKMNGSISMADVNSIANINS